MGIALNRPDQRVALTLGGLMVVAAIAFGCSARDDVPLFERRAQQINRVIMCPVCPGESIDQSQHPLAVQMRAMVEDKLSQDWTEEQIKSFFVEGYGPRVLMEPPREGIDLMVWLVPPAGLGMAAIMLYVALRFMTRRQSAERAGPSYAFGLSGEERDAYFARVEELAYDGSEITGQNDRATEPEEKGVN